MAGGGIDMGALYQLTSKSKLSAGCAVEVNGSYDRFGVVIKVTPKDDGTYLNLIRGTGFIQPTAHIVAHF